MLYTVSCRRPNLKYFHIRITIPYITEPIVLLQLPSWRPGRYELGNFAKNIQDFKASANGKALKYRKLNKDLWEIEAAGTGEIEVSYNYYAAELTAGSSFVDERIWYMNPVNCCMYVSGRTEEKHVLKLNLPDGYRIACNLKQLSYGTLEARNFDELADSPFIASPDLETHSFLLQGKEVFIHIMGRHKLDIEKLLRDFAAYSEEQAAAFEEYPCESYHYLFHFVPFRYHHGVEHMNSTVIMLGPGEQLHEESFYHELLAISSHEFYHLWNVKRIRPAEMLPYDYTRENYSRSGYVYEGVTTYMGDYMLLRSGVFNFDEYCLQFNGDLQRHFDNYGRFYYSVAESSFDTWLDGYVPGVPERKVSIYVEGMLAALILDLEILKGSAGRYRLDDVMNRLYTEHYKRGSGYTEADYKRIAEECCGMNLDWYFERMIHGRGEIEKHLPLVLAYIGCAIGKLPGTNVFERISGARLQTNGQIIISNVLSDSPAAEAGLSKGMKLLSINGTAVSIENINELSDSGELEIEAVSQWGSSKHHLISNDSNYYDEYRLLKLPEADAEQRELFRIWSKQNW